MSGSSMESQHDNHTQTILTNVFKLKTIPTIKYVIYSLPQPDDMTIIEAELALRKAHPKVLSVHYNRELWVFSISDTTPLPSPDPKFELRASDLKCFDFKNMARAGNGTPSNIMTLLSVTFLRALKKLLVVSLADKGEVIPFANAAFLTTKREFLVLSPKLGYGGEIFLNLATKGHKMWKMNSLDYDDDTIQERCAIYLAPSGIRVYLTQPTINASLTPTPANADTVVKMLKFYHAVTISENTQWVNMIPNLSHINGMTSNISKYLQPIGNTKYLAWPLELCYIQAASSPSNINGHGSNYTSTNTTPYFLEDTDDDPLDLIDDFVQLKATATIKTPSTTNMNTPLTTANTAHGHNNHPSVDFHGRHGSVLGYGVTPQSARDPGTLTGLFGTPGLKSSPAPALPIHTEDVTPALVTIADSVPEEIISSVNEDIPIEDNNQDWDDLDAELFGDDDNDDANPVGEVDFDLFGDDTVNTDPDSNLPRTGNSGDIDLDDDDLLQADLESELELLTSHFPDADLIQPDPQQTENEQVTEESKEPEFDIPLNEITVGPPSAEITPVTPPYQDPGAPLPITPVAAAQSAAAAAQRKRSIFSPLNFNPIIKSGVDDKYANGGKFFVNGELAKLRSEAGTPSSALALASEEAIVDDDDDVVDDDDDIISDTESEDEEDYDDDLEEEDDNPLDQDLLDSQQQFPSNLIPSQQSPPFITNHQTDLKSLGTSMSPSLEPESKRQKLNSPTPPPLFPLNTSTGASGPTSEDKQQSPTLSKASPHLPPVSTAASPSSASAACNVPNVVPFLLRPVTIHSIPSLFHSKPHVIPSPASNPDLLTELVNQLAWTDVNLITHQNQSIQEFDATYPDAVNRAVAQLFPDVVNCNIAEIAELRPEEGDSCFDLSHIDGGIGPNTNNGTGTGTNGNSSEVLSPFKGHDAYGAELKPGLDGSQVKIDEITDEASTADYQKSIWPLPGPKMVVRRLGQEISVNSTALKLWNLLGFEPKDGAKNAEVLIVSSRGNFIEMCRSFLQGLTEVYKKVDLGVLEKCHPLTTGGVDGVMGINGKRLEEVNWDDEIKKFQFKAGSELLVIFPDFEGTMQSVVDITTAYQSLKKAIVNSHTRNGVSTVTPNLKIIQGSYITSNGVPSILSVTKLTSLCLSLYTNNIKPAQDKPYTKLATSLPSKIQFQLTAKPVASSLLHEDVFIHLAYERSLDKEWLVASWCDNLCKVREIKAWNCGKGLDSTMNELWRITTDISAKLGSYVKKYLVLTRLDGVIPDDELGQWKRLSKNRDLSLIIVSVDVHSKLQVRIRDPHYPLNKIFNQDPSILSNEEKLSEYGIPTVDSTTGLTPSMFTPQPFANSPDLFTSSGNPIRPHSSSALITHDSPTDSRLLTPNIISTQDQSADMTSVIDISDITYALILKTPSSLSNSPNRLSIKTGYLLTPSTGSDNVISNFEVQLLTCPNVFSSAEELLRVLMSQFRRFSAMGYVYGVDSDEHDTNSAVPWTVTVVRRVIDSLVHLSCEDE